MPRTRLAGAILIAAGTLPVFAGPTFTTVALDDFTASSADQRWTAQVGSGGHVAYFGPDGPRLWHDGQTRLLHEIGTHLDGLLPDVVTAPLDSGVARRGRLVGVDGSGGVSVVLFTAPDPLRSRGVLASTTLDGGFRAVLARPEVADSSIDITHSISLTAIGVRRGENGAIGARAISSNGSNVVTLSPQLEGEVLMESGDRTLIPDREITFSNTYTISQDRFGYITHLDIASNGNIANYFWFLADGGTIADSAVARTIDGELEIIARSDTEINGVTLRRGFKPQVRINAEGTTLVATWTLGGVAAGESLLLYPGDNGPPSAVASSGQTIEPINHPPFTYSGMNSTNTISRNIALGDDGSVIFDVNQIPHPSNSPALIHRDASGEFRVLLSRDPDLLGLAPDESARDWSLYFAAVSLDASSAAGLFDIRTPQVTPTIFHATPRGVTRVVAVNDEIEVEPGDIRRITGVELLDVSGMRVLFAANFQGGSRGMLLADIPDPGCPADLNNDGVADADDFFLFLHFFADADPRADINNDGVIDADDFFAYLGLFAQGC